MAYGRHRLRAIKEMTTLKFILSYPPSTNTYWRHVENKVLISKAGREYRANVAIDVFLGRAKECSVGKPLQGRLRFEMKLMPPDNRRRDLDNTLKALLDALQHANVYEDDSQIDELHVVRGTIIEGGSVEVIISVLEKEK